MKITIAGKVFEVDDATITKAIEDKTDVSIDSDVIIRTPEENESYTTNLKNDSIKIGKEIGIKDFKKHVGIEIEGKDFDKVAEAFKEKIISESNISIDEKEKKWKADNDALKAANTTLVSEKTQLEQKNVSIENRFKIERQLDKLIPETIAIPKDGMTAVLATQFDFDISEDGQFIAKDKLTGKPLQDPNTLSPIPLERVINGFFETNPSYLKAAAGGAGGGDSGNSGKLTIEAYTKQLNEDGHETNSQSFNAEMMKAVGSGVVSVD
jgi:hypothetical protein